MSTEPSLLNKKYPKSQSKREDAITILSNDELKNFYNKGVEEGILQPMASYKGCRNLYDKMNQIKNESKSIIKREEREENLKKIDKSIISAINDIKKHKTCCESSDKKKERRVNKIKVN
ncbi:hypothetical protein [Wolbachia endosymbiont (group A) of Trypoxylon clavicerum]|uniref:hypothetical protein n=1 Tax=Wolbachia endosymbiont (group A) of Trypoxylon clavicerum TaxID=2954064 RepID=UPI0022313021|nr:hypothetical protein [Wolbachia endosymbiont (group A) of Trypoxylon clavicerum]